MADLEDQYNILLAAITGPGDESTNDVLLALWFLRNIVAVDELDAYEYVFDDEARPVDALYVERGFDAGEPETLHLIESKMDGGAQEFGRDVVEQFIQTVDELKRYGSAEAKSREFRAAGQRYGLAEDLDQNRLRLQPDLLLAGVLPPEAREFAELSGIRVYDLPWLAAVASALQGPGVKDDEVRVACPRARRFESETEVGAIAVCEVQAREIAEWPGIDDRSLFGLNVRGELRGTRVFDELDAAIKDASQHANFLAYHNGLTVICRNLDTSEDEQVIIRGLSVVNGAQSVLAFQRNLESLADGRLRVLVKFVQEDGSHPGFATEVARRSNTQTAVNARNLRANDARQQTLVLQFLERYPDYAYIVKQEATVHPPGQAIRNDDAAQWLCAIYNARPWLAVKRLELFRAPNYALIFSVDIEAQHVLLAHHIRSRLQDRRDDFPDDYRRSWRLTAVMALFLVGQYMRLDSELSDWLNDPTEILDDPDRLFPALDQAIDAVADVMTRYHAERLEEEGFDDFKVAFKREKIAHTLARRLIKQRRVSATT